MTRPTAAEMRQMVDRYRWMNDGAGLIVPPSLAAELRKMGINDGYTEQRYLPQEPSDDS